jgi:hypothetical protein
VQRGNCCRYNSVLSRVARTDVEGADGADGADWRTFPSANVQFTLEPFHWLLSTRRFLSVVEEGMQREGNMGRVAGGWRTEGSDKYCDMHPSNIVMGGTCSMYGGIGMHLGRSVSGVP